MSTTAQSRLLLPEISDTTKKKSSTTKSLYTSRSLAFQPLLKGSRSHIGGSRSGPLLAGLHHSTFCITETTRPSWERTLPVSMTFREKVTFKLHNHSFTSLAVVCSEVMIEEFVRLWVAYPGQIFA